MSDIEKLKSCLRVGKWLPSLVRGHQIEREYPLQPSQPERPQQAARSMAAVLPLATPPPLLWCSSLPLPPSTTITITALDLTALKISLLKPCCSRFGALELLSYHSRFTSFYNGVRDYSVFLLLILIIYNYSSDQ